MMHIVFNIDDRYVQHVAVCMASICINNIEQDITFHILTIDLSKDNESILRSLVNKYGNILCCYKIDNNLLVSFPTKGTVNPNLSKSAYIRLFVLLYLPLDIEKVLYLDADIVVNGNIIELWETDISNYAIAAVDDSFPYCIQMNRRLGYTKEYYFNSGVMLMNLLWLRNNHFCQLVSDFLKFHIDLIYFHDQDILNYLLHNNRLVLDYRWNMYEDRIPEEILEWPRKPELVNAMRHPVIIHYASFMKPWFKECLHPKRHLYYQYLAETPFSGSASSFFFDNRKDSIDFMIRFVARKVRAKVKSWL